MSRLSAFEMNECPVCKANALRFMGEIIVDAPLQYFHNMSKTAMRGSDVKIWGAVWENSFWHCTNCHAHWLIHPKRSDNRAHIKFLVNLRDSTSDEHTKETIQGYLDGWKAMTQVQSLEKYLAEREQDKRKDPED